MDSLKLPVFQIPAGLRVKQLSPIEYDRWLMENRKLLHQNGQLDAMLRAQQSPVDVRFVLPRSCTVSKK